MSTRQEAFVHNHGRLDGRIGGTAGAALPVPLGSDLPLTEAYDGQHHAVQALIEARGTRLSGFKISMTNAADQVAVRAQEPAYGHLTPLHLALGKDSILLETANFPLVEPELVFRTRSAIDATFTPDRIAAACDVAAGLEIPICRLQGWWPLGDVPKLTLSDFILDNAGAGRVVHGAHFVPADTLDLPAVGVRLTTPEGIEHKGTGARVLENPLNALHWLAVALARRGESIPAGAYVSSGTFMPPIRAVPGLFRAEFSHGLGAVEVRFH